MSIIDYPGFEDAEAPDMETFSKAMNAGQYPLSVLGMTQRASDLYIRGVYGNTMTANPRAIEVACAVLDNITPEFRKNVKDRGVVDIVLGIHKPDESAYSPGKGRVDSYAVAELDLGRPMFKGTDESFRILFNVLYGATPRVVNLEDYLIKPSSANYVRREVAIVELISGEPSKIVGQTLIKTTDENILIDTSPDLRQQLYDAKCTQINTVLFTHGHSDHTSGLPDMRAISLISDKIIPAFAPIEMKKDILSHYKFIPLFFV